MHLLLLLLLYICCCCCCFYIFVHVRANDWVELKVRPTPVCARCSNCFNVYDVCACVCMNRSSQAATSKIKDERTINVRTHTHAYVTYTYTDTLTHTNVNSIRLTAFGGVRAAPWLCWLYSPARNDRNVLKWDNCCFDWLHYYCCCLIFFLFAFLLFAKNHLCLYVDFFLYTYIFFCCCL